MKPILKIVITTTFLLAFANGGWAQTISVSETELCSISSTKETGQHAEVDADLRRMQTAGGLRGSVPSIRVCLPKETRPTYPCGQKTHQPKDINNQRYGMGVFFKAKDSCTNADRRGPGGSLFNSRWMAT